MRASLHVRVRRGTRRSSVRPAESVRAEDSRAPDRRSDSSGTSPRRSRNGCTGRRPDPAAAVAASLPNPNPNANANRQASLQPAPNLSLLLNQSHTYTFSDQKYAFNSTLNVLTTVYWSVSAIAELRFCLLFSAANRCYRVIEKSLTHFKHSYFSCARNVFGPIWHT